MDPLDGRILSGRYRIIRKLGQGGMGAVYRGEHIGLGKPVAIKVLLERYTAQREALARFHKEARAASMIAHENVVDVVDVGEDAGQAYIVMELLGGRDLAQVLREEGPLGAERATALLRPICRALAAAHQKGIIHRDMKPENVFVVQREGSGEVVKLMDFGISKVRQAREQSLRLTETGAVLGTPMYMSPEQARGELSIDHRVDIYALGVMTYEMLAGAPPFQHPTYLGLLSAHINQKPPSLAERRAGLLPELVRLVMQMLEKDPAARPASMAELDAALGRCQVAMAQAAARSPRGSWRRFGMWAAAGLLVAAGAAALGLSARRGSAPSATSARPGPSPPAPPAEVARAASGTAAGPAQGSATQPSAPSATQPAGWVATPAKIATSRPEPDGAHVILVTDPPAAQVSIDGVAAGTTPVNRDLPAGAHVFVFRAPGYAVREVKRTLQPGENRDVDIALEELEGSARAAVTHKTRPQGVRRAQGSIARPPPSTATPLGHLPARTEDRPPAPAAASPPANPEDHKPNPYQ
jgi:serine/threonine-protein kinase